MYSKDKDLWKIYIFLFGYHLIGVSVGIVSLPLRKPGHLPHVKAVHCGTKEKGNYVVMLGTRDWGIAGKEKQM